MCVVMQYQLFCKLSKLFSLIKLDVTIAFAFKIYRRIWMRKKQPLNFSIGPSSYRIDSYRINNPVEKLALGEVYIIGVSSIAVKGILNFFDI